MKKKDIITHLLTYALLAISFIMFIFAFITVNKMFYYIFSGSFLILFCVFNKVSERKILCSDGYNLLQAYFFYTKCERRGVSVKASKLSGEDMKIISEVAGGYDYSKGFDENKLKELYRNGREAKNAIGMKK